MVAEQRESDCITEAKNAAALVVSMAVRYSSRRHLNHEKDRRTRQKVNGQQGDGWRE